MLCDAHAAGSVQCYPVGGCAGAFGFCSAAHLWSCTFSSGSEIFRGILLGSQFLVSPDPSSSAFSASLCQDLHFPVLFPVVSAASVILLHYVTHTQLFFYRSYTCVTAV